MTRIAINVTLILECAPAEVPDAVNGLLRERTLAYDVNSCLIDYEAGTAVKLETTERFYAEGEAFL